MDQLVPHEGQMEQKLVPEEVVAAELDWMHMSALPVIGSLAVDQDGCRKCQEVVEHRQSWGGLALEPGPELQLELVPHVVHVLDLSSLMVLWEEADQNALKEYYHVEQ